MTIKKAAMFGLDARIALTIFGALSVITGVALYSALEKARTTAFLNELNEFGKAFEQYYLNTRQMLPLTYLDYNTQPYHSHSFQSSYLIKPRAGVKRWKGPYVKYKEHNVSYLKHPYGKEFYFFRSKGDGTWTGNNWTNNFCLSGVNCALWVAINFYQNTDNVTNLDKLIDNSDGYNQGSVRWNDAGDGTYHFTYKYMAIRNPYD